MQNKYTFDDAWTVIMFSFASELLAAEHTPLELVEQVLSSGLSKYVELDGPMHFRNFPYVSNEEVDDLKALLEKYGAGISLIGGYADRAKSANRFTDSPEVVESIKEQIRLAGRVGAYGLRLMVGALTADELRQVIPTAEENNVVILYEIQGPATPDSPAARACFNLAKDSGSANVRLMMDGSLFMSEFPKIFVADMAKHGVADENLEKEWKVKSLDEYKNWLLPKLDEYPPVMPEFLNTLFSRMGKSVPSDWVEYLPYVGCVHLKYWELEDDKGQLSRPTTELMALLKELGYQGFYTSEWGGHEWTTYPEYKALEMTAGHRALVEKCFNQVYDL